MESEKIPQEKYHLTIDLQVLKHLGIGLYSNLPAVISEMVANAYDADATLVEITTENNKIIIKDNGLGMDASDANKKFLTVGYNKRAKGETLTPKGRLPMGRKGIGKLSVFAIADTVKVESIKNDGKTKEILGKCAFLMHVPDIEKRAKEEKPYHPKPQKEEDIDFGKGTRITLTNLKRKQIKADFIIKNLAWRFAIFSDDFKVKINRHEVTTKDRQYWNKLQFVWGLGDSKDFQEAKKGGKVRNDDAIALSDGENPEILPNSVTMSGENEQVSGWIGTVHLPKDLKDNNIDNNGVVVMARGKLVHENILPFARSSRLFAEYVVGEINADWLDDDNDEDMATSNRQSLNENDPRFIALQSYVKDRLSTIAELWDKWRKTVGVKLAVERHPIIQEWLDTLKPDNKKQATKLIATIEGMPVSDDDKKKELFKHGIMAFETLALKGNLEVLSQHLTIQVDEFREILNAMADLDAAHFYQVAQNRWTVLKEFEKLVDSDAKEKLIQEKIYGNTWLLDSSWERPTEDSRMEKRFVDKLTAEKLGLDKNETLSRYDIKYLTVSGIDLVIELKKSKRKLTYIEVYEQVEKYNKIMNAMMKTSQSPREFEIIVILGEEPEDLNEQRKASLKALNAKIYTYEHLIEHSRKTYKDYLDTQKKVTKIQEIIDSL